MTLVPITPKRRAEPGDFVTDGERLASVAAIDSAAAVLVDARTDERFSVTVAELRAWRIVTGWRAHGVA